MYCRGLSKFGVRILFILFISTNVFIVPYIHLPHPNPSKNKNVQNKTVLQYSRQIQVTTVNDHKSLKFKHITNNKNQLR